MRHTRHTLSALFCCALAGVLASCSESHSYPIDSYTPLTCYERDEIGCCGASFIVHAESACPGTSVERSECRTTGCDECLNPISCVFGDESCCDFSVRVESCSGECPAGYIEESRCITTFEAPRDPIPETNCRVDYGAGCCGEIVGIMGRCGCPEGTIEDYACEWNDAAFPPPTCFVDLGSGCCGESVQSTSCGTCPPGSTNECANVTFDLPQEPQPAPRPPCMLVDSEGCCVGVDTRGTNSCGSCHPGAIMEYDCPAGCGSF